MRSKLECKVYGPQTCGETPPPVKQVVGRTLPVLHSRGLRGSFLVQLWVHTPCLSCPETWRTAKPWTTNSPGCNFSLFTVSLSVTCFLTWLLMPVAMSPTLTRWNSRICRCSPLRDWIWTLTPRKPRLRVRESEGREEAGYSGVGVGRREAGRAKGNLCEVTRGVEQVWLGQSSREQIQGPEYYTALPG